MSIFGKLTFWKKGEEGDTALPEPAGLGDETGIPPPNYPPAPGPGEMSGPDTLPPPAAMPEPQIPQPYQAPQPAAVQSQQAYTSSKDIEIISVKLDSLRAAVENLSQRIAAIERMARDEEDYQTRRRGW